MEQYTLDGEKYYYKNGKWLTSNFTSVPIGIVSKLNSLVINNTDFENMSMDELREVLNGARDSNNTILVQRALDAAMDIATISDIRSLLPRLTSNYRKMNNPQMAIDVAQKYLDEYEKKVWSPALFTSIAAAYCDVADYDTARQMADRARGLSANQPSGELINVYSRLKSVE